MLACTQRFSDAGTPTCQPDLTYFHPKEHGAAVVNTDRYESRHSETRGQRYSVADHADMPVVRIMAGNSPVFGIGASADRHTLTS